jgi:hypothetical protein
MNFPRLFSRIQKITPRRLYWSVSELDALIDTDEFSEYMTWLSFHGLKSIKPSQLVRFYVQGVYKEQIRELFEKHKQFKQISTAYARREKRAQNKQNRALS